MVIDSTCVLCGNGEETIDHLIFHCCYAHQLWGAILHRCNEHYRCMSWAEEVVTACARFKGDSFKAKVGKLAFNVIIYMVWHERNNRIFRGEVPLPSQVMREIENCVCAKA